MTSIEACSMGISVATTTERPAAASDRSAVGMNKRRSSSPRARGAEADTHKDPAHEEHEEQHVAAPPSLALGHGVHAPKGAA
jgi:hypothetical protein